MSDGFSLAALLAGVMLLPLVAGVAHAQGEGDGQMTREEMEQQVKDAIAKGSQLYQEEDFEGAVRSFDFAVTATGGQNPTVLYLHAQALIGDEQYEQAISELKEVLTYGQATPGLVPQARNLRARAYLDLGAVDRAMKDAEAAVNANRLAPQFQFNYGEALVRVGDLVRGEKALTRYILAAEEALAPEEDAEQKQATFSTKELPEAYRWRAQAYTGLRKYPKALADADRAIELDPEEHEFYFMKAVIFMQEEEYESAAATMQQAIDNYTPDDPDLPMPYIQAHLQRASLLEEIGKKSDDPEAARVAYLEGKKECELLVDELPDDNAALAPYRANAYFRLGVLERLLDNLAPAVKAFTEAIDINPGLGEAYFRRGICFFNLGEPRLALGDFEQGAAINFDNPQSNLWKGRCHAELGDMREAIKAYSSAVAVSDRYTIAYVHRGLAYMHLREFQRALGDFDTAIRLAPTDGQNYYLRGIAYQRLQDAEKALDSYVNAIRFAPELLEAYDGAATLLEDAGRRDLAREYRNRAAEIRATQSVSQR